MHLLDGLRNAASLSEAHDAAMLVLEAMDALLRSAGHVAQDAAALRGVQGMLEGALAHCASGALHVRVCAARLVGELSGLLLRHEAAWQGSSSSSSSSSGGGGGGGGALALTLDALSASTDNLLLLSAFDVRVVLAQGQPLAGHGRERYATAAGAGSGSTLTAAQRVRVQRAEVLRVLGMEGAAGADDAGGTSTALMVTELHGLVEDADLGEAAGVGGGGTAAAATATALPRRRGRAATKTEAQAAVPSAEAAAAAAAAAEGELSEAPAAEAPSLRALLALVLDECCYQLFHPVWMHRHGAACALLELLRTLKEVHSEEAGAGAAAMGGGGHAHSAALAHPHGSPVLQDIVLRLIAVLALDRFGDFSGAVRAAGGEAEAGTGPPAGDAGAGALGERGGVRAPVREAVALALSFAATSLTPAGLHATLAQITALCAAGGSSGEWCVRHGCALGLGALANVLQRGQGSSSSSSSSSSVQALIAPCISLLADASEDAAAAAALALHTLAAMPSAWTPALRAAVLDTSTACAARVCHALPLSHLSHDLLALAVVAMGSAGECGLLHLTRLLAAAASLAASPSASTRAVAMGALSLLMSKVASGCGGPAGSVGWYLEEACPVIIHSAWRSCVVGQQGRALQQLPPNLALSSSSSSSSSSSTSAPFSHFSSQPSGLPKLWSSQALPAAPLALVQSSLHTAASLLQGSRAAPPAFSLQQAACEWPWAQAALACVCAADGEVIVGGAVHPLVFVERSDGCWRIAAAAGAGAGAARGTTMAAEVEVEVSFAHGEEFEAVARAGLPSSGGSSSSTSPAAGGPWRSVGSVGQHARCGALSGSSLHPLTFACRAAAVELLSQLPWEGSSAMDGGASLVLWCCHGQGAALAGSQPPPLPASASGLQSCALMWQGLQARPLLLLPHTAAVALAGAVERACTPAALAFLAAGPLLEAEGVLPGAAEALASEARELVRELRVAVGDCERAGKHCLPRAQAAKETSGEASLAVVLQAAQRCLAAIEKASAALPRAKGASASSSSSSSSSVALDEFIHQGARVTGVLERLEGAWGRHSGRSAAALASALLQAPDLLTRHRLTPLVRLLHKACAAADDPAAEAAAGQALAVLIGKCLQGATGKAAGGGGAGAATAPIGEKILCSFLDAAVQCDPWKGGGGSRGYCIATAAALTILLPSGLSQPATPAGAAGSSSDSSACAAAAVSRVVLERLAPLKVALQTPASYATTMEAVLAWEEHGAAEGSGPTSTPMHTSQPALLHALRLLAMLCTASAPSAASPPSAATATAAAAATTPRALLFSHVALAVPHSASPCPATQASALHAIAAAGALHMPSALAQVCAYAIPALTAPCIGEVGGVVVEESRRVGSSRGSKRSSSSSSSSSMPPSPLPYRASALNALAALLLPTLPLSVEQVASIVQYLPLLIPGLMATQGHSLPRIRMLASRLLRTLIPIVRQLCSSSSSSSSSSASPPADLPEALAEAWHRGLVDTMALANGALAALARLPRPLAQRIKGSSLPGGASSTATLDSATGVSSSSSSSAAAAAAASSAPTAVTLPPGAQPLSGLALRPYQVEGIAWLDFLRRTALCGVLADDMGLGKTVQALCAVAASLAAIGQERSGRCFSLLVCPTSLLYHWAAEAQRHFPAVLTVQIYEGDAAQRQGILSGLLGRLQSPTAAFSAAAAAAAAAAPQGHTLLLASYGTIRRDLASFTLGSSSSSSSSSAAPAAPLPLLWCILDEGHLACNPSTALFKACCALGAGAAHRLVLTGTPVHSGIRDLWGLFAFLQPGYLGSAEHFRRSVEAPLGRSRAVGAGQGELALAQAALGELHSALLPLIMRRLKGDVLLQLPTKTVVDVLVPLAPMQRALYGAFVKATRSTWLKDWSSAIGVEEGVGAEGGGGAAAAAAAESGGEGRHLFSALHLLRQVLGHPDLVSREALPEAEGMLRRGSSSSSSSSSSSGSAAPEFLVEHSCKLLALRDIFLQLGFECQGGAAAAAAAGGEEGGGAAGPDACGAEDPAPAPGGRPSRRQLGGGARGACTPPPAPPTFMAAPISLGGAPPRRVLVFSQLTGMLDAVERGLLGAHFPGLGYARLEGSTPARQRAALAQRFNSDPQQRVLLLSTGAGGLGLNLTGADTVVFLDHDWNPCRDAQAQDRAHRLGQTRAVTVYRLLAQGTVEEAIMGQQTWKLGVAGAVVGRANGSLAGGVGSAPILEFLGGGARAPPAAAAAAAALPVAHGGGKRRRGAGGGQHEQEAEEEAEEQREAARAAQEAAALAMLQR